MIKNAFLVRLVSKIAPSGDVGLHHATINPERKDYYSKNLSILNISSFSE